MSFRIYLTNSLFKPTIFHGTMPLSFCFEKVTASIQLKPHMEINITLITSPSVSVASRRITHLQRPLRDLCSFVFGATLLKETTKNIIFVISMLDYPIWSLESSLSNYFEICVLYVNKTTNILMINFKMRNSESA